MAFWLVRITDLETFSRCSLHSFWLLNSKNVWNGKKFFHNVKKGDIIWFILPKSEGLIVAMAKFKKFKNRELGPLVNLSMTNSELKLPKSMKECDTEMYFSKLYNLDRLNLKSNAKFARDFCEAGPNKNRDLYQILTEEYQLIKRYSKLKRYM